MKGTAAEKTKRAKYRATTEEDNIKEEALSVEMDECIKSVRICGEVEMTEIQRWTK